MYADILRDLRGTINEAVISDLLKNVIGGMSRI